MGIGWEKLQETSIDSIVEKLQCFPEDFAWTPSIDGMIECQTIYNGSTKPSGTSKASKFSEVRDHCRGQRWTRIRKRRLGMTWAQIAGWRVPSHRLCKHPLYIYICYIYIYYIYIWLYIHIYSEGPAFLTCFLDLCIMLSSTKSRKLSKSRGISRVSPQPCNWARNG